MKNLARELDGVKLKKTEKYQVTQVAWLNTLNLSKGPKKQLVVVSIFEKGKENSSSMTSL